MRQKIKKITAIMIVITNHGVYPEADLYWKNLVAKVQMKLVNGIIGLHWKWLIETWNCMHQQGKTEMAGCEFLT